ncbi:hemerythrin domain-containing protein [Rhodococcus sp. NPDC056960]|uniref:hemerythrin domain-containing protein n=1 Tax=Rhodococcus sp. NPDC056960 TaxID=3345982 RepID=UPI003638528D
MSTQIDTQLFGIIHDAVRRDLGRIFDALATRTPPAARRRAALADHLTWTLRFLERVHVSEEAYLWDLTCRRDPSATSLLRELAAGHVRVHHAASAVEHAAHAYQISEATSVRDDLRGALERLCTILLPQLDREEAVVAPIVATTIADIEWNTWLYRHLLHTDSAEELARERQWLTDALEPGRRTYARRTLRSRRCSRIRSALKQLETAPAPV